MFAFVSLYFSKPAQQKFIIYDLIIFCSSATALKQNLFQAYYSYSYYFSKYDNHIAIFHLCHLLTMY